MTTATTSSFDRALHAYRTTEASPRHVPTEGQVQTILQLLRESGIVDEFTIADLLRSEVDAHRATRTGASGWIDRLIQAARQHSGSSSTHRPNRFAGTCARCSSEVPAQAGMLLGSSGNWRVEHLPGSCPDVVAAPAPAPRSSNPAAALEPGYYALHAPQGAVEFYRVRQPRLRDEAATRARRRLVRWDAGRGDRVLPRDQWQPVVERIQVLGVEASHVLFGRSIGRCGVCGRTLSDPESVALGIGPVCLARIRGAGFTGASVPRVSPVDPGEYTCRECNEECSTRAEARTHCAPEHGPALPTTPPPAATVEVESPEFSAANYTDGRPLAYDDHESSTQCRGEREPSTDGSRYEPWVCTRPLGHAGLHEARGAREAMARWADGGYSS